MLTVHTKREVKLVTVDRGTAWVVVAFLVETTGSETRVLSGPRIVKIVQKKYYGLPAGKKATLALAAPISRNTRILSSIQSPFVSTIFGYTNSDVVIGLAARPPTLA